MVERFLLISGVGTVYLTSMVDAIGEAVITVLPEREKYRYAASLALLGSAVGTAASGLLMSKWALPCPFLYSTIPTLIVCLAAAVAPLSGSWFCVLSFLLGLGSGSVLLLSTAIAMRTTMPVHAAVQMLGDVQVAMTMSCRLPHLITGVSWFMFHRVSSPYNRLLWVIRLTTLLGSLPLFALLWIGSRVDLSHRFSLHRTGANLKKTVNFSHHTSSFFSEMRRSDAVECMVDVVPEGLAWSEEPPKSPSWRRRICISGAGYFVFNVAWYFTHFQVDHEPFGHSTIAATLLFHSAGSVFDTIGVVTGYRLQKIWGVWPHLSTTFMLLGVDYLLMSSLRLHPLNSLRNASAHFYVFEALFCALTVVQSYGSVGVFALPPLLYEPDESPSLMAYAMAMGRLGGALGPLLHFIPGAWTPSAVMATMGLGLVAMSIVFARTHIRFRSDAKQFSSERSWSSL
ncbi:MAG: hypothetical protein KVP17_004322 [Porospora cf. gigantea B]|uniref:uncharacterized protein n=1 Tax=Porospora cf. gigantea B TaxID=2853592 RepID=UPI0035719F56|nr:MAG: hypothetical protein KVP17_004322 [Porospora cf. gigantea B]